MPPFRTTAMFLLVLLLMSSLGTMGCDGGTKKVCQSDDYRTCECPVGEGVQYCKIDGSAYLPCVCPIKEMSIKDHVIQLDDVVEGEIEKPTDFSFRIPLEKNERLFNLQPREIVVSLNKGRAGRVTRVYKDEEHIFIETEPCAIKEIFADLKIDLNSPVNMNADMPPELRESWRNAVPTSGLESTMFQEYNYFKDNDTQGTDKTTTEIAGTSFTFDGAIVPTALEIDPASYFNMSPKFYFKMDLIKGDFAFATRLDMDLLLKLRAAFEAWVKFTGEIEMVEFTMCLIDPTNTCCDINCAPLRTTIIPGITVWTWVTLGCELNVDGSVDMYPEFGFQGSFAGGVFFSENWSNSTWDDAGDFSSDLADDMLNFKEGEVEGWGTHSVDGYAKLNPPFIWTLNGNLKCYVRPKVELSFLEMGGPYIEGGPYVEFDTKLHRNYIEFNVGMEAEAGGEFNPFGQKSIFDWSTEILNISQTIWRYSWKICGDGVRQTNCPGHEFLPSDDFPDSNCETPPEECDAGPFFGQDGQGLEWAGDVISPCIPPNSPGECTCAPGFAPRDHLPVENWEDFPELHRGYWTDGNNICVPTCGNGQIDANEECDHGQGTRYGPGDSDKWGMAPSDFECFHKCSWDCTRKVGVCGDGIKECWEECDDGNRNDCDGCDGVCREELVTGCGDGKVCPPEMCDDGNNIDGDGCSSDCLSTERCLNGVKDPGEECDDGNLENSDGCDVNCTVSRCGNGIINYELGEECDDGNDDNCDACSNTCVLNRGWDPDPAKRQCDNNGVTCPWEECDDGNLENCDSCHINCTPNTGCGDGVTCYQDDEQCDLGENNRDCGCLVGQFDCSNGECVQSNYLCDGKADCQDGSDETGCDGLEPGQFLCDNGDIISGSALCNEIDDCGDGSDERACLRCSTDCKLRIGGSYCGDGYVCGLEECDPNDGSGEWSECGPCHVDCTINTGCGDGHVCGDEKCDDGNRISGDGCSADCQSDETCGNGYVDPGEACDDGNRVSGDNCRDDCKGIEVCGDGYLDAGESCEDTSVFGIDLNCPQTAPHCLDCSGCYNICGDGYLGTGETCERSDDAIDPGCSDATPICKEDCSGCEADCSSPVCGDGVVCASEACDDGNDQNCDGCNNDCTVSRCGDGIICPGEACDDGNNIGGDGCRADCTGLEVCGDGIVDYLAGESCEDTSAEGQDLGCSASMPHCNGDTCVGCVAHLCGNGVVEPPELCDGNTMPCYDQATGYAGTVACQENCFEWSQECVVEQHCGDGEVNGFEECDDGNNTNCDGCTADCRNETGCGDGVVCGDEECDDGNNADCDGCTSNCFQETGCGDGFLCAPEVCDDGNNDKCVGHCNADCTAVRHQPLCGDGFMDTECGEVCEDTSPTGRDEGCPPETPHCLACGSCTNSVCGDGVVTPPETCDDGGFCFDSADTCTTLTWETDCINALGDGCFPQGGDGCSETCQLEICGDGILNDGEECDDGNNETGDGCDANCNLE